MTGQPGIQPGRCVRTVLRAMRAFDQVGMTRHLMSIVVLRIAAAWQLGWPGVPGSDCAVHALRSAKSSCTTWKHQAGDHLCRLHLLTCVTCCCCCCSNPIDQPGGKTPAQLTLSEVNPGGEGVVASGMLQPGRQVLSQTATQAVQQMHHAAS